MGVVNDSSRPPLLGPPESADAGEEVRGDPAVDNMDGVWLQRARSAFVDSTTWMEGSVSDSWQRNTAHFQNRHAPGSKFASAAYRNRSRTFRPKTRSMVRNHEAAVAQALFSGGELVTVTTNNDEDPMNAASAAICQELLNYRLTNTLPWFLTAVGAYQDALTTGVCVSYQHWLFQERVEPQLELGADGTPMIDENGMPVITEVRTVVKDQPAIDLLPPENVRIDPACDWRDPIGSSPYVIRLVPMYIDDVLEEIERRKTSISPWREYTVEQLMVAQKTSFEATKREREDGRQNAHEAGKGDFSTIWLHEVFMRRDGREVVYWTVGTELMLSDPVPLEEVYFTGKRPIVMGYATVEAHRAYPESLVGISSGLQESTNDIANQRMDNVQLVLNKRYFIKRGQNVDIEALMRNVPGGGVMVDDPMNDVNIVNTPDVTSSSYAEQDRLDLQFDELVGQFSQSSVQNNRNLNETVGGMQMLQSGAGVMAEYTLRTWVETWVEPVLRQLLLLEQRYETDEKVIAIAAADAELMTKFGVDQATDDLLRHEVNLYVNVGMGSTNPEQKVQRLMFGLGAVGQLPDAPMRIKSDEIIKEVFSALGYRSGMRFFKSTEELQQEMAAAGQQPDPETMKLQMQAEMKQAELQIKQAELEMKAQDMQARRQFDEQRLMLELQRDEMRAKLEGEKAEAEMRVQYERMAAEAQVAAMKMENDRNMRLAEIASRENVTMAKLQADGGFSNEQWQIDQQLKMTELQSRIESEQRRAQIDVAKLQTMRDIAALKEKAHQDELKIKREVGSGI